MPKPPVHPIRAMLADLARGGATWPYDPNDDVDRASQALQRKLRRHVKPLLDALERACERHNVRGEDGPYDCPDCRLLARWRAKCQ